MTDWTGRLKDWKPPDGWRQILTIDVHAAGEPGAASGTTSEP
mgnify:FL=1|jgi:hypothetical protein